MNYYIEIKFQPDDEIPLYFIRNKLYAKLHKVLFDLKNNEIGVSFPNGKILANSSQDILTKPHLGDIIRLHSKKENLEALQIHNWLGGLSGYCHVNDVQKIPISIKGYCIVSRKQNTMTLAKLQKRINHQKMKGYLKTKKDVESYSKQYKEKMNQVMLEFPYIELRSSKGGDYRRYIQFGDVVNKPISGEFDAFGLSKNATVPWF